MVFLFESAFVLFILAPLFILALAPGTVVDDAAGVVVAGAVVCAFVNDTANAKAAIDNRIFFTLLLVLICLIYGCKNDNYQ
jgi:hypothetical protein